MPFTLRRNREGDLAPLALMLDRSETGLADLELLNPHAQHPFDPLEWQEKWLGDPDDVSFYILDDTPENGGTEVGFFALRVGAGPEIRHLTYVYVAPEARGGAGALMADLVERAARDLEALTVTLKCETGNEAAFATWLSAGYEELSRRDGMATMRLDL